MTIGFKDEGFQNYWKGCESDSPTVYGMYVSGFDPSIIGCRFNTLVGINTDNTAYAIYFPHSSAAAPTASIIGNYFNGGPSTRFLTDIAASSTANIQAFGNVDLSVASPSDVGLNAPWNGTAASPYFTFQNDPTTGVFMPSVGIIGLSAGGVEGLRIDSSGHIFSGLTAGVSGSGPVRLQLGGTSFANSSEVMARFTDDSDSPYLVLTKSRGTTVGSYTAVNQNDALGRIYFQGADGTITDAAASIVGAVDGTVSSGIVPGKITFNTANTSGSLTEAMRITSGQLVGIGTTTPGSLLSIGGIVNFTTATSTFYGNGLNLSNGCYAITGNCLSLTNLPGIAPIASGGTATSTQVTDGVHFYNGSQITSRTSFVFTNNGFLGIGTTTPIDRLDVYNGQIGFSYGGTDGLKEIGLSTRTNVLNSSFINGHDVLTVGSPGNTANPVYYFSDGNVGIGTTTPYSRLTIWGADTASSTLSFNVVNNASTTVFAVFNGGNAQLSGTLTQSSDARLKTNIQSLDASTSLAAINSLTPVAYDWLDPNKGGVRQYGFIAQQVQQVFPNLVSTTSATALTPDGTLGLNYIGLIAPLVEAVQQLSAELQSLTTTVQGFAQSFTSKQVTATQRLCVDKSDGSPVCLTGDQLAGILSGTPSVQINAPAPLVISGTSTPPSIDIQGANPANINVGDTYTDLGALVTDNQGHDLSYRTFINGALSGNILIDTSQVATDTIDYAATDTWGNTATSTRTVIIEAATASTSTTP